MALALGLPTLAPADPIAIARWAVDGGGANNAQGGQFMLAGTAGQAEAGLLTGPGFSLLGGFWFSGALLTSGLAEESIFAPHPPPLPRKLRIGAVAPNPVLSRAGISLELPSPLEVDVRVIDVRGALVRVLRSGSLAAGLHRLEWNLTDERGDRVPAGIYFVKARAGELERLQRLVVLW